jgi:hypothetical protein
MGFGNMRVRREVEVMLEEALPESVEVEADRLISRYDRSGIGSGEGCFDGREEDDFLVNCPAESLGGNEGCFDINQVTKGDREVEKLRV